MLNRACGRSLPNWGSTLDTTVVRFTANGGMRNAEEEVLDSSVVLIMIKDYSVRHDPTLCYIELMKFVAPEYDEICVPLTSSESNVRSLGAVHKVFFGHVTTVESSEKGNIRTRKLCVMGYPAKRIVHCGVWFRREKANDAVLSYLFVKNS